MFVKSPLAFGCVCLLSTVTFGQAPPPLPPSLKNTPPMIKPPASQPTNALTTPKATVPGHAKPQAPARDRLIHPPELMLDLGAVLGEVRDLAFSPNGQHLAVAGDRVVRVFEVATGRLLTTIRGDRSRGSYGSIMTLAYSPDGAFLLIGIVDHHERGSIRLYRTNNLQQLDRLIPGLTAPCRHVQFSPDGRWMIACDDDGEILLYDWARTVASKQPVIRHRIESRSGDSRIIDELQFPEDSQIILSIEGDGPHAYRAHDGAELTSPEQFPPRLLGWSYDIAMKQVQWPFGQTIEPRIYDFQLHAGRWVAAGFHRQAGATRHWAAVFSARAMRPGEPMLVPKAVYAGHRWGVNAIALSPDGSLVASGDKFGEIHLWRTADGKAVRVLRSPGKPVYAAAIDRGGERLGIGFRPELSTWGINQYGELSHVIDLRDRVVRDIDSADDFTPMDEVRQDGGDQLVHRSDRDTRRTFLQRERSGKVEASYRIPSGKYLSAYTFVDNAAGPLLGTSRPVLFGDHEGFIGCWDATGDQLRRAFRGHENMVTSISVAPKGNVFVTGSTDKTLRVWSLKQYDPSGIFDFRYEGNVVYRVEPNTDSARAGVAVGDRFISANGVGLTEFYERLLSGERVFEPHQQVEIEMRRGETTYRYPMRLRRGFDYVEPLLNLFVRDEQTWILWTPEGYYDCSPGADALIGWHVNHGPERSAEFFRAEQFRELMYRPDIVRRVLSEGVFGEAIAKLESEREHRPIADPLRDADQFAKVRPPSVRSVTPLTGAELKEDRVVAEAVVEATGELPITEVTLMVNGVPASVIRPKTAEQARSMKVSERVKLGPGRNTISWIASNRVASSDQAEAMTVVRTRNANRKPNLVALVVGVNDYRHAGKEFTPLRHAVDDATRFEEALRQQGGGELYEQVKTRVLTNEQATRSGVLDGLTWLVESAEEGDTAMLFFSMHGFLDERDRFYLAGHDVQRDRLRSTGISWDAITDALHQDLPGCRRLVFIDACHAGGISPDARSPLNELTDPKLGVTFFASCELLQQSIERDEWNHGAFTKSVLDALADRAADISPKTGDGLLDSGELTIYVRNQVLVLTGRRQHPVTFVGNRIGHDNVFESRVDDLVSAR